MRVIKVVFMTGTRADYGKLKSLMKVLKEDSKFEVHVFVTGMHMLEQYGSTYKELTKDRQPNIYTYVNQGTNTPMDIALSNTITGFSSYVEELKPDAIIVHGDRLEALAGAIVGAFRNIRVFHIEGGEVSGTIDESIRHAITKFSHYHFVANEDAAKRITQLGEPYDHIFIFGSPDIDIMYSDLLPSLETVKQYYEIPFTEYRILMYHPVTTETKDLEAHCHHLVDTVLSSGLDYVIIYPNNDTGSQTIIKEYERLRNHPHIRIFPSMRFEYFLTLLKNAKSILGNSSSGVREAAIYGVTAIDLGTRQMGRYNPDCSPHIVHLQEDELTLEAIIAAESIKIKPSAHFGSGNSDIIFHKVLSNPCIWKTDIQKRFVDVSFSQI